MMTLHWLPSGRSFLKTVGVTLTAAVVLASASPCLGGNQGEPSSGHRAADDTSAPGARSEKTDGHLPPIDCPLHGAGIDPRDLKPFEEVEDYIAFLERADRLRWQKPDEVVSALGLRGDETVVDLGAGSGYFTFRLAKALPRGKVVAVDTQPEMIRHIHRRVMSEGVSNVEARVADPHDPELPAGTDMVFLCDVLHHIQERPRWLETLHARMPSGARIVLIEFKAGKLPEGPPEAVKIPKDRLVALVREAGFRLQRDDPDLLPYQEFLAFVKP